MPFRPPPRFAARRRRCLLITRRPAGSWMLAAVLTLAASTLGLAGCKSEPPAPTVDPAMVHEAAVREAIAAVRASDLDAARRHLDDAAAASTTEADRLRVASLRQVIVVAEQLMEGDGAAAAEAIAEIEHEGFRREVEQAAARIGVPTEPGESPRWQNP